MENAEKSIVYYGIKLLQATFNKYRKWNLRTRKPMTKKPLLSVVRSFHEVLCTPFLL